MRMLTKILALILFIHFSFILYTNRSLFFSKFDEAYWKDKYEHSQWKLPLSVRTLGDDGLYLYEGYRLIHGGDPTLLNAEVPPLGKYLIGLSTLVFGNGHWYGFLITTLALLTFFFLSKSLLGNNLLAFAVTTLVAVDPLITSQFPLTMLDSLQLLFLLLAFLLLLRSRLALAGLAFGLFSETKFPILAPALIALIGLFWWKKHQGLKGLVLFLGFAGFAYLLPYTYYFILGHNLIDWLGVQKWIASFYANSNLTPNVGSALAALLTGRYQNLFTKAWQVAPEWSPTWTIVTILAAIAAFRSLSGKWLLVSGFTLFSLVFFTIIPFWTRYLVLLLPFFYLAATRLMTTLTPKLQLLLFGVLLVSNITVSNRVLFPTPESMVKQFSYNWRYGFFHDMYEDITRETKLTDRAAFRRFGLTAFAQAEIESVNIDILTTKWSRSPQDIELQITYFTRHLGPFTEKRLVKVIKEDGRWKIPWQWSLLIEHLNENALLETTVAQAKRGNILASDKTKLGEDFSSFLIWITPENIDKSKEDELLKFLESLFDRNIEAIAFHERLVGNSLPDIPIPLGVLYTPLTGELKQKLLSYPGVSLTPSLGRLHRISNIVTVGDVANTDYFECCSLLYTTTTYNGIDGVEKERNSELKGYNGGTLVIKDNQGNVIRTILDLPVRDGKDAQL